MDEKKRSLTTCYPIIHNSTKILMVLTDIKSCDQREQEVSFKCRIVYI